MAFVTDTQEYHLLSPRDDVSSDSLYTEAKGSPRRSALSSSVPWRRLAVWLAFVICIVVSFALGHRANASRTTSGLSPYINLAYDHPDQLWWNTEFSSESASESALDELWDTSIPWESGIIALKNEDARAMNLPESQPWPWDSDSKSIYIVNAHHILHCVRNLYISIQQYRKNESQTISYPHILHCLDSLRTETMCTADDTLRYVPLNSDGHGSRPGDGQYRQCRNWDKAKSFAESHDACYRYLNPGDKETSNLERFKFCPADSEYLPKIRKYFGYSDDWVPDPPEGPRELQW